MTGRPRVWPVLVTFGVLFVLLQLAGALVLGVWAYATMRAGAGPDGFLAQLERLVASPPGLTVAALISSTGLGLTALAGGWLAPERWGARLRFTTDGLSAQRVALVVVGTLAVSQTLDSCVALLGLSRFGALDHINQVLARAAGGWLLVLTIAVALGPGLAEEMFFRGFMQTRLTQRWGAVAGIAVTAACFGLLHFDLVHTPVAAVLGVFLGWSAERSGSIVPAIVAHVVNNLVAVLTARWPAPASAAVQAMALAASLLVIAGVVVALQRAYRGSRLGPRALDVR